MRAGPGMITFPLPCADVAGEPAQLQLRIENSTAELFSNEYRCAVFDREVLREWLTHPIGDLTAGDVSWTSTNDGVVLIVQPAFVSCPLLSRDVHWLRAYL
jgi:hypothetical protein